MKAVSILNSAVAVALILVLYGRIFKNISYFFARIDSSHRGYTRAAELFRLDGSWPSDAFRQKFLRKINYVYRVFVIAEHESDICFC